MPKYPSISSSGRLCPCSENNPNNPALVPMPQDLAGLLRAPTFAQQPRPPLLAPPHIHFFSIRLLFTFPALFGLVPGHSDLCSLPGSQVILSQGPSRPRPAWPLVNLSGHGHTGYHWVVRLSCSATPCEMECAGHSRRVCGNGTRLRCRCSASVSIFRRPVLNRLIMRNQ